MINPQPSHENVLVSDAFLLPLPCVSFPCMRYLLIKALSLLVTLGILNTFYLSLIFSVELYFSLPQAGSSWFPLKRICIFCRLFFHIHTQFLLLCFNFCEGSGFPIVNVYYGENVIWRGKWLIWNKKNYVWKFPEHSTSKHVRQFHFTLLY